MTRVVLVAIALGLAPASAVAGPLSGPYVSGTGSCVLDGGVPVCWSVNHSMAPDARDPERPNRITAQSGLVDLDVAEAHACGLDDKGGLHCWGGRYGSEGDIVHELKTPAVPAAIDVSLGEGHQCVISTAGDVWCWGANDDGQSDGTTSGWRREAVKVPGVTGAVELALGAWHSCARTKPGKVLCWGRPKPNEITADDVKLRTIKVPASAQIVTDREMTCSRSTDGKIDCWGWSAGNLSAVDADERTVHRLGATPDVAEIAVANASVCARSAAGAVACAGYFADSLAHGEVKPGTFVAVPGISGAVAIDAGGSSGCARTRDDKILCWGEREQLGGIYADKVVRPVAVRGLTDVVAIDAEYHRTCALDQRGDVKCWGGRPDLAEPVAVPALAGASQVSVASDGVCAVVRGAVRCHAFDDRGHPAPGVPPSSDATATHVEVPLAGTATAVGTTRTHGCARAAAGTLTCWGYSYHGEAGRAIAESDPPIAPAAVGGLRGVTGVAVAPQRTCAIVAGGVRCFGSGEEGRLGDGRTVDSATPRAVKNLDRVVALSLGENLACARRDDGTAACWGADAVTPVSWPDRTDIVDLAATYETACIVRKGGTVECGLPGVATAVAGITDATAVAAGREHSCVLRRAGTVACWGARYNSVLGDGVADFVTTAVEIPLPR